MLLRAVLVSTCLMLATAHVVRDTVRDEDGDRYRMPPDFLWGAGISAIQTEGAINEGGKAESVLDHLILSGKLPNTYRSSHAVAADSYHRYKEDVAMAASLKLKMYKLSISWSRVLPTADASNPNTEGVQFYHDLIDEIIAHGMTPLVTMLQFDHPQILEDQFMGWQSRQMVDKFAEYSKFIFDTYGAKVPLFVTINEPNMYCTYFARQYVQAGFRTEEEVDPYPCVHNEVLGHLAAYRIYQQGKREGKYNGKVGYTNLLIVGQPATGAPEDVYASEIFNGLYAGTSLNPVVYGDHPQVIKALLGDRLPQFTEAEKAELVDSTDFIGINIYFGVTVSYNRFMNATFAGVLDSVMGQMTKDMPFVDAALSSQSTIDPSVMKNALMWTWKSFKKPIIITENGYADALGQGIHDTRRAAYHSAFLRSLVTTVKDYDVDVLAYSAWSLIDSFEFATGYENPFGLVHVDYANGTLDRSLKDSSTFWTQLAETGVVPFAEDPDAASTTITATTRRTPTPTSRGPASTTPRSAATAVATNAYPMVVVLASLLRTRLI